MEHRTGPSADADDEPEVASAPRATVFGRRVWPVWLCVVLIISVHVSQTALGLVLSYPSFLYWLPIVLVSLVALAKVVRFSMGLVGVAAAAAVTCWSVDQVVSAVRLQALGATAGQWTISVPSLVAAAGSIPLAVVLCGLLDGHVRSTVREWVRRRGGVDVVRAAVVVLAVVAALFPVVSSVTAGPDHGVVVADRDQVPGPGYASPDQVAERMQALSISKGRPVSVTCRYGDAESAAPASYRCVAVTASSDGSREVHDGITSTGRPDGTFLCADFTRGVERRLC